MPPARCFMNILPIFPLRYRLQYRRRKINLIILNHELISEAEFRDIHVRFVKEIKKLDKDDKKNVILYTQLHLIISCLEEVELCLIKMI